MCRLYGLRANEPTKVECTLVHAQNALMVQSAGDLRGKAHTDGWGIAFYEDGRPTIERRPIAAFEDAHFNATAERVYSQTVMAHIRQATVGTASLENTHPFCHGPWTFAHNGSITAFDDVRLQLESEIDISHVGLPTGTTDSELAFHWLLSRMARQGMSLQGRSTDLNATREIVGAAVREIAGLSEAANAPEPAQLNFLLTDGHVMVASCWNRSLFWVHRDGLRDCEVCGIPHVHHDLRAHYHAIVVASEPISHESWQEIPNHSIVSISADLSLEVRPV